MAGANTDVQGQAAKPAMSVTLKMIIAGIIFVILTAGISFAVAMLASKSLSHGTAPTGGENSAKAATLGSTLDVGEFVTNLYSEAANRFVKVKVVLAFQEKGIPKEIELKKPVIQHVINSTLRQQSPEGLSEPKAMENLAELLKKNINVLLDEGHIINVYFTSFVVQ